MTGIEELLKEHRQLEERAARLTRIAELAVPDPAAVAGERWQMVKMLRKHWANEERVVCEPLLASDDAEAVALATESHRDHDALDAAFGQYIADWPVGRIAAEWIGFRLATLRIVEALATRMTHEDQVLYPSVERTLTRRAA